MNKRTKAAVRTEVPFLQRPLWVLGGIVSCATVFAVVQAIASPASEPVPQTATTADAQAECSQRLLSSRTCWIDKAVEDATR